MFRHLSPKAVTAVIDAAAIEFSEALGETVVVGYEYRATGTWNVICSKGYKLFSSHTTMCDWVEDEVRWRNSILMRQFP